MRLLYVIEKISTKGGLERILIDKMNALAQLPGYEVFLMTVWKDHNPPAYQLSNQVHTLSLGVSRKLYPLTLPLAVKRFNKEVRTINPDVTIQFRAVGSFLTLLTTWKGRTILESHTARCQSNHRWLLSLIEDKVDAIVCLTQGNAEEYGKARRVEVIPNFTNMAVPNQWPDYQRHHCICVGRFHYIKNHSRLIDIWQQVHSLHPDWVLDIYGDGELRADIERKIHEYDLAGCIVIHGNTDDIQQAYLESSFIIMTSISEGLPMALIEAQQCGLPIISFDCPFGPADIIDNDINGYIIPYHDDKAMTFAVSRLINDATLRQTMGHNARQAARRFSKDHIIRQWTDFFTSLTS